MHSTLQELQFSGRCKNSNSVHLPEWAHVKKLKVSLGSIAGSIIVVCNISKKASYIEELSITYGPVNFPNSHLTLADRTRVLESEKLKIVKLISFNPVESLDIILLQRLLILESVQIETHQSLDYGLYYFKH